MALTDKQIDGVLAAQKDIDAITQKLPPNAPPSQKAVAQLDAVAKKNGFASYDEYNDVVDNITLVLSGIDPTTKKYVGFDAATKAQIAAVQANKQMSAKDKKDALAELNESLKSPAPPVANKGNIDLVVKNYDKLADVLGGGQQ
jgi:Skp family chaperone for outer membrane proteins